MQMNAITRLVTERMRQRMGWGNHIYICHGRRAAGRRSMSSAFQHLPQRLVVHHVGTHLARRCPPLVGRPVLVEARDGTGLVDAGGPGGVSVARRRRHADGRRRSGGADLRRGPGLAIVRVSRADGRCVRGGGFDTVAVRGRRMLGRVDVLGWPRTAGVFISGRSGAAPVRGGLGRRLGRRLVQGLHDGRRHRTPRGAAPQPPRDELP
ncbi:hypothetical protein VTK73DRAFT_201 [Phialemonium thermophilum]|uniref:Uncharacterized protein n=1 Tax=Phialemonium thermophilum TaxID=223376 RepID=A0ABR3VWG4_9PEZI